MKLHTQRPLIALLVAMVLVGLASSAFAVTDQERAGARAQAVAGAESFDAGRWQEALDRFRRAEAVVHSPVHLVYIGKAQIQLGQLVEAQETLIAVARETLAPDAPEPFLKAKQEAEALLVELEPRIPQLTVTVEGADPGAVKLTMNGNEVPSAFIGVPRPVNPGEHRLEATADGLAGQNVITVAEGQRESVVVQLTPQEAAPAAAAASVGSEPMDTGTDQPAPSKEAMRIGSYVAFGVGAVGLGVGTIFALQFAGKKGDSDDLFEACTPNCSTEERNEIEGLDDDANSAGTVATIGFIAGGVGIAAGVTLLVLSLQPEESPAAAGAPRLSPYVGLDRVGVTGTF